MNLNPPCNPGGGGGGKPGNKDLPAVKVIGLGGGVSRRFPDVEEGVPGGEPLGGEALPRSPTLFGDTADGLGAELALGEPVRAAQAAAAAAACWACCTALQWVNRPGGRPRAVGEVGLFSRWLFWPLWANV